MTQRKYVSLSKLGDFLDNLNNTFSSITHNHTLSDITDYEVDAALSSASTNPVQNKVIDAEFEAVSTAMNALDLAIDGKADASHNHSIDDVENLQTNLDTINDVVSEKSKVQVSASGATKHIPTLTIHRVTQAEYDKAVEDGTIDEDAIYLTPDEEVDLSGYATLDDLDAKSDKAHSHDDVYYTEVEIDNKLDAINSSINSKAEAAHNHDDAYYTEAEIDSKLEAINNSINLKVDANHNHDDVYYTEVEVDEMVAEKSQVQIVESDEATHLPTLKIHKVTQAEYDEKVANGTIDKNAIYLTPNEKVDLAPYATIEQLNAKADLNHSHKIEDVENLQTLLDEKATQEFVTTKIAEAQLADSDVDLSDYYTKSETDTIIENAINGIDIPVVDLTDYATKEYADNSAAQKSKVQIVKEGIAEHLQTLNIHKVTQEEYDNKVANGTLDDNAIYLVPDEKIDLSPYATIEQLNAKADTVHNHDDAYYTEGEIDTKIDAVNESISGILEEAKSFASSSDENILAQAQSYADNAAAQKSQVQIVRENVAEHLSTLKIHKMSQAEYDQIVANGAIDENALYLTPTEKVDMSAYATLADLRNKADAEHTHTVSEITDFESTIDAIVEELNEAISGKLDANHNHDSRYYTKDETDAKLDAKAEADSLANYYTKTEIDNLELITVEDIDAICGATIAIQMVGGNKVEF